MILFTIGYEGLDLDRFFALLRDAEIETILDVRQLPLSRKKGFSKNALRAAAQERDITYRHLSVFGCPKPIRDQYKVDKEWECYTVRYTAYLESQIGALNDLVHVSAESRCCLLCFEADAFRCHRSLVAARAVEISATRLQAHHLSASPPTDPGRAEQCSS